MHSLTFNDDSTVKRLRWVMVGAIIFSLINTLAGQPPSFWHDPETAIRFDGLSIHSQTNPMFDFFLGLGWQAYLACTMCYCAAAFLMVSLLPRKIALVTTFSLIFAHYFTGSSWLAVRWHFGVEGAVVYGIVIGTVMTLSVLPAVEDADAAINTLRWPMLGTMILDYAVTLAGQPASFWHRPETMREGNQLARVFLAYGWPGYIVYALLLVAGTFLLLRVLPKIGAMICVLATTLGAFGGASNWSFYDWRMGIWAPVAYGIVVSVAIVSLAFANNEKPSMNFMHSLCNCDG
jgi:hypothetical protein